LIGRGGKNKDGVRSTIVGGWPVSGTEPKVSEIWEVAARGSSVSLESGLVAAGYRVEDQTPVIFKLGAGHEFEWVKEVTSEGWDSFHPTVAPLTDDTFLAVTPQSKHRSEGSQDAGAKGVEWRFRFSVFDSDGNVIRNRAFGIGSLGPMRSNVPELSVITDSKVAQIAMTAGLFEENSAQSLDEISHSVINCGYYRVAQLITLDLEDFGIEARAIPMRNLALPDLAHSPSGRLMGVGTIADSCLRKSEIVFLDLTNPNDPEILHLENSPFYGYGKAFLGEHSGRLYFVGTIERTTDVFNPQGGADSAVDSVLFEFNPGSGEIKRKFLRAGGHFIARDGWVSGNQAHLLGTVGDRAATATVSLENWDSLH